MAEPVSLEAVRRRRAAKDEAAPASGVVLTVRSEPGVVVLVVANESDSAVFRVPPEQAFSLAEDIWRAARAAKGADHG